MALADILQRITEDSLAEASAIVREAEDAAAAVRADAEGRARERVKETVSRATIDAGSAGQTRLATARLSARDSTLAAKRSLVERVISGVTDHLESLPADEYVRFIVDQVAEVARGNETVSVGQEDEARLLSSIGPALAAAGVGVSVRGVTSEISRGVLVEGDRVKVEVSPRALVASRKDQLVAVATEVLFGDGHSADGEPPVEESGAKEAT